MLRSSGFWDVAELWRLATSNAKYDDLLKQKGSAYIKFRLTSDDRYLKDDLTAMLKDARENLPLITTEGYFTDRIEIRNLRSREDRGAGILESMYLGAPLVDLFYPFSPIFWNGFDVNFSALVLNASPTGIAVRMFNHGASAQRGRISFLQLKPGRYTLSQGSDINHDGKLETVTHTETLTIAQRNVSWPVSCAPGKEELLVVQQLVQSDLPESALCDLAVNASELRIVRKSASEVEVTIPVHNIGTLGAANVVVEILPAGGESKPLARTTVVKIDAPLDMVPKIEKVSFTIPSVKGSYMIRVSLPGGGKEITDVNNSVTFTL
jgi:hypothetical protein